MKVIDQKESKTHFSVGIVVSRFNQEISKSLLEGAVQRFKEQGFSDTEITVAWVPGAVEIPLAAQRFAQNGTLEAVVCLGAIIKGETDHYDMVCRLLAEGVSQVALQNDIPVIFGVLTTKNEAQAKERAGGKEGNKGREAADAAIEMVGLLRQLG